MATWGFHEGELAVQRLAGVEPAARRLEGMLAPAELSGGGAKFLALQRFAALTARDSAGVLWTSPLAADPGFLRGDGDSLRIAALPRPGDPLREVPVGQQVGLIAIDFNARRRVRINGILSEADGQGLVVTVDQAYGNCPQHIHRRDIDVDALSAPPAVTHTPAMTTVDQALVAGADTFFLGTTHPTRGNDASHRGGPPGFVRVTSPDTLWWPDFDGNNMFNSFGNLAVDDEAALLFTDFDTGATVQMSGTAAVQWEPEGRRVVFTVRDTVSSDTVSSDVVGSAHEAA